MNYRVCFKENREMCSNVQEIWDIQGWVLDVATVFSVTAVIAQAIAKL